MDKISFLNKYAGRPVLMPTKEHLKKFLDECRSLDIKITLPGDENAWDTFKEYTFINISKAKNEGVLGHIVKAIKDKSEFLTAPPIIYGNDDLTDALVYLMSITLGRDKEEEEETFTFKEFIDDFKVSLHEELTSAVLIVCKKNVKPGEHDVFTSINLKDRSKHIVTTLIRNMLEDTNVCPRARLDFAQEVATMLQEVIKEII